MDASNSPRDSRKDVTILTVVILWVAAVVFYWLVNPIQDFNLLLLAGIILSYILFWGIVFLLSHASRKEVAQGFLLSTIAVLCTVGFLELLVVIHLVDFRRVLETPVHEPWDHPENLPDAKLLHIHKPYDRWLWYSTDYRYDQHGLRNETDFQAADLVVIGDSFIEGIGVSAADLLTAHLAKQLNRTVANIAQSWYGPQQELELFRRYGLRLNPKTCVWMFFEGNDLDDIGRYKEATRDWEKFSSELHSFTQRSFTKNSLLAVRRLLDSLHHNSDSSKNLEDISGTFETSSGRKTSLVFWYKGLHLSEDDYKALDELLSVLDEAYQLCGSIHAKLLVVFIPTKFRVYHSVTEFDVRSASRYWVINDLPKRLEGMVQKRLPAAEFLDLTPALAHQAGKGSLVYKVNDSHWSGTGHRVAAAAIADFLNRWEKIGSPPRGL